MDPTACCPLLPMHQVVLATFSLALTAATFGTCPPPPRGSSDEHDHRPLAYAGGHFSLGRDVGVSYFKYEGNNNLSWFVFWEEESNEQLPGEAGSMNNQMDKLYYARILTDTWHEAAMPVSSHYVVVDLLIELLWVWSWRSFIYIVGIALFCTLRNLYEARGICPKAQEGLFRDSESTWTGETEPENSRFAKNGGINAVAKTAATWLVASAATHHATANRGILSGFEAVENGVNIQAGDGVARPVRGRGSVITETVVLPDVWFVPGLANNIVSASQLIQLDYSIVFTHGVCHIEGATDGTVIGKASARDDGMFQLEFLKVPLLN